MRWPAEKHGVRLEVVKYTEVKYGPQFLNVLQAALRAGKARRVASMGHRPAQPCLVADLIAPSQLPTLGANCEGAITRNANAAIRACSTSARPLATFSKGAAYRQ